MLSRFVSCVEVLLLALAFALAGSANAASKDEQRAQVRKTSQQVLTELYRVHPPAKGAVAASAGYAVFSNFGVKIFVAGGGSGSGIAVNNSTKAETFMKMVEVQAGLGFGIKKFRVVFVFETQKALNDFINSGWEFGGQATAAAQYDNKGAAYQGAVAVNPGVWMYQLTGDGLALELTGKGTKYYKDDALN